MYLKLRYETTRIKTDRKSTRLNSSHLVISYAVFCLKKKKEKSERYYRSHRRRSRDEAGCALHRRELVAMDPLPLETNVLARDAESPRQLCTRQVPF